MVAAGPGEHGQDAAIDGRRRLHEHGVRLQCVDPASQPRGQDLLELCQGAHRSLLDAVSAAAGGRPEADGQGDRLVVLEQQWRHGRPRGEPVATDRPARGLDLVAEAAQPLDVVPDGPRTHLEPVRQLGARPVAWRLEEREQAKQPRRGSHDVHKDTTVIRNECGLISRYDRWCEKKQGGPRCRDPKLGNPAFEDRAPIELPHTVRMRVLGAVMVGVFLAALDQTVVGTALPQIITDLGGNDLYTWAFTAYLLTSTISGPLYGKLSDLFGRRPIFLFGIGVFMLGSLLAGLSQEMWQLVAARGVQGLGAGALFPIALAVIGDLFAPSERGRYQGLFGAVFGLSVLIGPAIGGLITDTIGWPFVFFINLPVGAAVFFAVWRYLPAYHLGGERPKIDYLGAALFTGALVPILVGLTNKRTADWTDPAVGGLIALGARSWPSSCGSSRARTSRSCRSDCSASARSRSRSRRSSWRPSVSSRRSSSCRAGSRSWTARRRRSPATRSCRCSAA